jgi:hypothetical protein
MGVNQNKVWPHSKYWLSGNPISSCDPVYSFGNYEGDPLSPLRVRQPKGSVPLTPAEFSLIFCGLIPVWGMPEAAGVEASDAVDLREWSVIKTL